MKLSSINKIASGIGCVLLSGAIYSAVGSFHPLKDKHLSSLDNPQVKSMDVKECQQSENSCYLNLHLEMVGAPFVE